MITQVVNESPEIFCCRVILLGPGSESVLLFEVPIIQPAFMVITINCGDLKTVMITGHPGTTLRSLKDTCSDNPDFHGHLCEVGRLL